MSIEEKIVKLEERIARLEKLVDGRKELLTGPTKNSEKKYSIKEFINEKCPRNMRETTLAVASYLENDGICPFNITDLEKGFRAAKIPPPKNINDMANKNISRGFLMEAAEPKDGKKAWELTATGEQEVENGFG